MKIRLTRQQWLRIGQDQGWAEDVYPDFDPKRMKRLVDQDVFFTYLFNDMKKRLPDHSDEYILEVIFNSEILENSIAVARYEEV